MNKSKSVWYTYILQCADGSFYTGITTDINRRLRQHNGDLVGGAKYTMARRPVEIVFSEECASRSLASKREYEIKQLSRTQKMKLINNKK